MIKIDFTDKEITRQVKNALNRTLTKVRNLQKDYIYGKHSVKKKYLHNKRLNGCRARSSDLSIRLTSTSKFITPFMQARVARPDIGNKFGTQTSRYKKGKFYISSKKHSVSGYTVTEGLTSGIRKRPYYYIQKRANLDDELLDFTDEAQNKAIGIFQKELDKG
ncbi:hypothetical protein F1B92_03920 [Campylobacter sp. FMV-PI01]|uniref:Uncharacterized protein n=1 Tax=Campylobacter portucalensis TaxID=2608384 RepID=A0A6L5WH33_9BACT|nr:hypothetical protein [Campylobacter portucalensis]MSN96344.1 hypothetical protein [Campylobacter portucalensis]